MPTYHYLNSVKVVAQSITNPSYIDGVPFVEVGEDEEQLAIIASNKIAVHRDGRPDKTLVSHWLDGYKAAQAKQFTEEDLRKAIFWGSNINPINNKSGNSLIDDYISSLKPKVSSIEIEMTRTYEDLWIGELFVSVETGKFTPKTYQKDGKTFLKVSKINYAK